MTAEPEPELPGVDEYAVRLETAHRAAAWPGIPDPDVAAAASTTTDPDPTADLREQILRILQR